MEHGYFDRIFDVPDRSSNWLPEIEQRNQAKARKQDISTALNRLRDELRPPGFKALASHHNRDILLQEIETASDEVLAEAIDFIRFLKIKSATNSRDDQELPEPVAETNSEQLNDPKTAFGSFLADLKQLPLQRAEPLRQDTKGRNPSNFIGT